MVDLSRFSPDAMEALVRAKAIASQGSDGVVVAPDPCALGQSLLTRVDAVTHLMDRVATGDPALLAALTRSLQDPPEPAPPQAVAPPPPTLALLEQAQRLAGEFPTADTQPVELLHLWCAVFASDDAALRGWLEGLGLQQVALLDAGRRALTPPPDRHAPRPLPAPAQRVLARFTEDWTAYALAGKLRPAIGRREAFERLCEQLLRLGKRNVVLTGEGGVGKTFLVRHLAWALIHQPESVPAKLRDCMVVSLDLLRLRMGGGVMGELEQRTRDLIAVLEQHGDRIILFIDELHTIIGAQMGGAGALDLANAFKPLLAEGAVRCIGATTPMEYNRYIASDPALARRFAELRLPPLSAESTLDLLFQERSRFEHHAGCTVDDAALQAVIDLSQRYMPNRQFPDKAIDLLDAACAHAAYRSIEHVTADLVRQVLARDLNLPEVDDPEMTVTRTERALNETVVGQDAACAAIARALVRGFRLPPEHTTPRAVLFFTGPSRVGKTLAAQTIGRILCSRPDQFLRIDMNEYVGSAGGHGGERAVHRLLGPPPPYMGYERGGILTNHVSTHAASVILLDEFEKADLQVQDLFLGIFDRGIVIDGLGRTVSFRDCYFVLTSNLLPDLYQHDRGDEGALRRVLQASNVLRAEFINRLTAVIAFAPLGPDALQELARRAFEQLQRDCLQDHGVQLRALPEEVSVTMTIARAALHASSAKGRPLGFAPAAAPVPRAGSDAQTLAGEFQARVATPVADLLERLEADGDLPDWIAVRVEPAQAGDRAVQVVAGDMTVRVSAVSLIARLLLLDGGPQEVETLSASWPQARWSTLAPETALAPLFDQLPPEEVPIIVVPETRPDLVALMDKVRHFHPTLGVVRRLAPGQAESPESDPPGFVLEPTAPLTGFGAYVESCLLRARAWQRQQRLQTLHKRIEAEGRKEAMYEHAVAPLRAEGGLQS